MDDQHLRKPRFWPVLILSAFVLGTMLWSIWMVKFVQKTREQRNDGFFVPMGDAAKGADTNAAGMATNLPVVTNTNSATTNAR